MGPLASERFTTAPFWVTSTSSRSTRRPAASRVAGMRGLQSEGLSFLGISLHSACAVSIPLNKDAPHTAATRLGVELRTLMLPGSADDPSFLEERRHRMPSSSWMFRSASDEVSVGAVAWAASSLVLELFLLPAIVNIVDFRISEKGARR